ncbi:MAG: glycosyltransferase family 4 protein, partial [Acidimicrobiia bacterium]|nr:glycosyltransferase family 4 protein [Acidimicrobiia bacterium]
MATLPPRAQDHQPVIVTFVWPSSSQYTGGVVVLYRMANALARRGAEVQFVHGPKTPWRVANVGEITWFDFDPAISHFVVDDVDDPSIPNSDVVMIPSAPARFGLPVSVIQGHRMVNPEWERANYRFRGLKVVVARWLAELGEEYGVPVEQMVHVPCGIEHDLFRVIVPLDRRPVDVAVLYNRHPSKAWTVARDALERVRIVRPELSVQVFGLADPAHDVPDWMQFAIADDRRVLAEEIFNCSKVLLQASWHEGFGLSAVEGMASGCALVTTDNGGSRDYATDRSTALVCDRGDAVGLAAAVVELLENDDLRHRIAAEGIARAGEFTSETSGDRLYRSLADYVADPGRFQAPLGPDRVQDPTVPEGWHLEELDLSASDETVDDGPRGVRVSAVRAHSPGSPREEELVWNIVWTGAVFDRLKYFVASQIAQSKSRFRFVVNGCEPGEVDKMEEFRAKHPDRVVEVMHVFDDMKAHGQALDVVLDSRDDGPCFCLIDPDIKASAPFVGDLLALLPGRGAVTSGKEIWSRDSVLPDGHPGVAGEFFIGSDGFVYGSPHLAIYDRRALLEVRD